MTVAAPDADASPEGASGRPGVAALLARRLGPRQLLSALAIVLLAVALSASFTPIPLNGSPTARARITSHVITALSVFVAVVLADVAVDRGARRLPAYLLAVVGGSALGALLCWPLREALGVRFTFQGRVAEAAVAQFSIFHRLDQLVLGLLLGGLATFVHVNRRTALAARRRQHAAERARARARRRTLESQLQALQARVEPTFLFNTLARIRILYRRDAPQASATLDDLIVYLRSALPHLRETTSTLEQEASLVRAWLDIVGRAASSWQVDLVIDRGALGVHMPALVLLPLVQCAVTGPDADSVRLRVAARKEGQHLRIEVATASAALIEGASAQSLAPIEQRLQALFGAAAALAVHATEGGGSAARVTLPIEAAVAVQEPGS